MLKPHELIRLARCDSTNEYLKRPLPGSVDKRLPVFVLADRQTAGRGRLGRGWSSPLGGIYLSLLWPEKAPAEQASSLPLVVALAVMAACQPLTCQPLAIKWPNDVLVANGAERRKLSGVLVEMEQGHPIIGVGVNVYPVAEDTSSKDDGAFGLRHATAMHKAWLIGGSADLESGPLLLDKAVQGLVKQMLDYVGRWQETGWRFAPFREEYGKALIQTSQQIEVRDVTGGLVATGEVQGVDEDGRLIILGEQGINAVWSGEVTSRI
jgi:BirA family biotin operon repressor/biotin-[acetyl-CoA-carboxylase] ligase